MRNPTKKIPLSTALEKGLILDLLYFFTSNYGTSLSHHRDAIFEKYNHIKDMDRLLEDMIDHQLLLEEMSYPKNGHYLKIVPTGRLRLTHDSIGPIVLRKYSESLLPSPVARKMISSKNLVEGNLLSKKEVRAVEEGTDGMRMLGKDELNLLTKSRNALNKNSKRRQRIIWSVIIAFAVLLMAAFIINQLRKAEEIYVEAVNAFETEDYRLCKDLLFEYARNDSDPRFGKLYKEAALSLAVQTGSMRGNEFLSLFNSANIIQHPLQEDIILLTKVLEDNTFETSFYEALQKDSLRLLISIPGSSPRFSRNGKVIFTTIDLKKRFTCATILDDQNNIVFQETLEGYVATKFERNNQIVSLVDSLPMDKAVTRLFKIEKNRVKQIAKLSGLPYKVSRDGQHIFTDLSTRISPKIRYHRIVEDKIDNILDIKDEWGDFYDDIPYFRTYSVLNARPYKQLFGSNLYDISGSRPVKLELDSFAYRSIFLTNWPEIFLLTNNDNSIFGRIQNGKLEDIGLQINGRVDLLRSQNLDLIHDNNSDTIVIVNFTYQRDSLSFEVIQKVNGISADFSPGGKYLYVQKSGRQSTFYKRSKNGPLLYVPLPKEYTNLIPYDYLHFYFADTTFLKTMLNSSIERNISDIPGHKTIRVTKDLKYGISRSDDWAFITDFATGENLRIDSQKEELLINWRGKELITFNSNNRSQTLIWHKYPWELTAEELESCFIPD